MFEKIEIFDKRYSELSQRLYEPSVAADPEQYQKTMKELKSIEEIVLTYREYKQAVKSQDESIEILEESGDSDLKELAQLELDEAKQNIEELSEKLKILLLPKDPNDERNVIVEIRGGAGGEESALFSAVLFRMYSMYAEKKGYKVEIVNANETELGGYKEISFMIEGEGAYSRFKYESGVHRVQRVPETESQGRVHTSTTTVAVLPEAEDVELEIDPKDLKIDTFRSSGAGGQHIVHCGKGFLIHHGSHAAELVGLGAGMHLAAVIVHIHERRVAVVRCKAVELIGQRQCALLRIGSRHGQIAERDLVLSHRAAGTRCTEARAIMHQHAAGQEGPHGLLHQGRTVRKGYPLREFR